MEIECDFLGDRFDPKDSPRDEKNDNISIGTGFELQDAKNATQFEKRLS